MKALAWYTVVLNSLIIVALILVGVGVVPPAPFTLLEDIAWAVLTVPVIVLGILVVKRA